MRKIVVFFVVGLFCFFVFGASAQQESPYHTILQWQTSSFYPSNYQGKPLPSDGSLVRVSLQLLRDNKIIDASSYPIKWYANNKYFREGTGLTEISFRVDESRGDFYSIKASVTTDGGVVSEFLTIPIAQPELILESTATNGGIKPNSSVTFSVVPYFFNIQSLADLNISWNIQGQKIANEKKSTLFVQFGEPKTDSQREIIVGSSVKEKGSFFSTIENAITIHIEK